jgi:hypothetical protein
VKSANTWQTAKTRELWGDELKLSRCVCDVGGIERSAHEFHVRLAWKSLSLCPYHAGKGDRKVTIQPHHQNPGPVLWFSSP